jgi:3-oxoacyl-[acyl-carrier protein] reductase
MAAVMTRLGRLDRSVDGRVALITGAASGMGRATAHVFADEGARVALVDKDGDGVARVVAEIEDSTGSDRVMGRALDVTDRSALERLVQDVVERWGGIDCLVNNAGVSLVSSLLQDEGFEDAWQRTLDFLAKHIK